MGKKAVSYTDAQRESLIEVLDDMHGNPYEKEGATLKKRVYIVLAFTEYDDGIAGSIGAFGSKGITLSGDIKQDADVISNTDLATICSAIAAKEIEPKLDEWTGTAQVVRQGAKFYHEDSQAEGAE